MLLPAPRAHAAVAWHTLHTGESWHLCQALRGSQQLLGQAWVWKEICVFPISIISQKWDVICQGMGTQTHTRRHPAESREAMAWCHPSCRMSGTDARAVLLLLLLLQAKEGDTSIKNEGLKTSAQGVRVGHGHSLYQYFL